MERRTATFISLTAGCLLVGMLLGCHRQVNYNSVLTSGSQKITEAVAFRTLFSNTHEFLTYFDGYYGEPQWNSKALLHGRYVLTLQCKIGVDYAKSAVTNYQTPRIFLTEIVSLERLASGQTSATHGTNLTFNIDQWKQLMESHGAFESLGVNLSTNSPIDGLEACWWSL